MSGLLLITPVGSQAQEYARSIPIENPGFERVEAGAIVGWDGTVAEGSSTPPKHEGFRAVADPNEPSSGLFSLRLESIGKPERDQFGAATQAINAVSLRDRRVRLSGMVRTEAPEGTPVGLWLRIDRESGRHGFFDNMADRPISTLKWQKFEIEGVVGPDASRILFGMYLAGAGRAWLDDVKLEVLGPARPDVVSAVQIGPPRDGPIVGDESAGPIDSRGVANLRTFARVYGLVRWFHPSDAAASADWTAVALAGIPRAEAARSPKELAEALQATFAPIAPTMQIAVGTVPPPLGTETAKPGARLRWRHNGMGEDPGNIYSSKRETFVPEAKPVEHVESFPGGVAIRLPLTAALAEDGKTLPAATAELLPTGKPDGWVPAGFDRTTRLAATTIAWNLFKHFYPYWDQAGGDWDAALGPALEQAALAPDDRAFHQTLRRFTALPRDGHTWVWYVSHYGASLPLDWEWVEDELVVTAVEPAADGIKLGAIIEAIDGQPVAELIASEIPLIAGSPQWRLEQALQRLRSSDRELIAQLSVRTPSGALTTIPVPFVKVPYSERATPERPDVVAELAPGIVYVDITRLDRQRFQAESSRISAAEGLVFDLRGYPKGEIGYLAHLSSETVLSAKMDVPTYVAPDAAVDNWRSGGWELEPKLPRYSENVAFVTDASAISFSESILGTVKGNRLGTIIGEATAGANGNITQVVLPGGYAVSWTAMRVVNRDGSPHHIVGLTPDLWVEPTIAGIQAERDEVLEAAVMVVLRQIAKD